VAIADAQNTLIGGTAPGDANVISGNTQDGLLILADKPLSLNLQIVGNLIGTDPTGTTANPNFLHGVAIQSVAGANDMPLDVTIGGTAPGSANVISGNVGDAINISGAGTSGIQVLGNWIGTNLGGTAVLRNGGSGVAIGSGASGNTVGGTTAAARNVISNNTAGVFIAGGSTGNLVEGNYVGTDVSGSMSMGNSTNGVLIQNSPDNTVGGTTPGAGNLISANVNGVELLGSGSVGNIVQGNLIGTDATGEQFLSNTQDGVRISAASGNTIGGTTDAARNLISGNGANGVEISGTGNNNLIEGNWIGVDLSDMRQLGNGGDGVAVLGVSANGNTVGGADPGARNVIAGNFGNGVDIGLGAAGNMVLGNAIGTDRTGTRRIGNSGNGVTINDAPDSLGINNAPRNVIGLPGAGNVISNNSASGVYIFGPYSIGNVVQGNNIGTTGDGRSIVGQDGGPIGNAQNGVYINSADGNTIGGASGAGNVISGNGNQGILIYNGATGNVVIGNSVGTDRQGTLALGNLGDGVEVLQAADNTVGAPGGNANLIDSNRKNGVELNGADNNAVIGNFIGTNPSGATGLGNALDGILVTASSGDQIGGAVPDTNVISGNGTNGIEINNAAMGTAVLGNLIGVNPAGSQAVPNKGNGIAVSDAGAVTIGGTDAALRNVISGNGGNGVSFANTSGSVILGNFAGTDVNGQAAIPNGADGLLLDTSGGNSVGGTAPGAGNVLSGNLLAGLELRGTGTTADVVQGNTIGPAAAGESAIAVPISNAPGATGNQVGVVLSGTSGNLVGGTTPEERNLISGNRRPDGSATGVEIIGPEASANVISGNYIGTDATGASPLGNDTGIFISGAAANTIGGSSRAAANVISGNGMIGVHIFGNGAISNQVLGNLIGVDPSGSHTVVAGPSGQGILVNSAFYPSGISSGGATLIAGNVISGFLAGIEIYAPQSPSNKNPGSIIQDNFIGTDRNGEVVLGNTVGIYINGVPGNTIGGTTTSDQNIITGNDTGIDLFGRTASNNVIEGNSIGLDAQGTKAAGNHVGIFVDGATNNTIGGPSPADRNYIAGNKVSGNDGATGILYFDGASGNVALNNDIGTDVNGKGGKGFGEGDYGVLLFNAPNNQPNRLGSRTNKILGSGIAAIREFTGPVPQGQTSTPRRGSKASTGSTHQVKAHAVLVKDDVPHGPRGMGHRRGRFA
jgi:hypothetical protein